MKFYLNSDDKNYASLFHYDRLLKQMDLCEERMEYNDYVINICSIANSGFIKGNKCSVYIEGDEFIIRGNNKDIYKQSDIVYINNKEFLSYYPDNTKILNAGVDPEWHYPRDIKKEYDYSFIASIRVDPVYNKRREILEELKKKNESILITTCTPYEYPEYLCKGRIILNILPETDDGKQSANYRILEGCACGTLMTNTGPCIDDLGLIPNVHYLPLERFDEKISDEELQEIHEAGRAYVCEHYSYQNAIKMIVKDVEDYVRKASTN